MKRLVAGLSIAALSVFGIGCDPEPDAAEEAAEDVGSVLEDAGDAVEDAADEVKDEATQ